MITVEPGFDFTAGGPVGGPFTTSQTYTVTSLRPTETTVAISADVAWIEIDASELVFDGTGEASDLTVGFSAAADDLPAGIQTGTVSFTNMTDPLMPTVSRDRHARCRQIHIRLNGYAARAFEDNSVNSTSTINDPRCLLRRLTSMSSWISPTPS